MNGLQRGRPRGEAIEIAPTANKASRVAPEQRQGRGSSCLPGENFFSAMIICFWRAEIVTFFAWVGKKEMKKKDDQRSIFVELDEKKQKCRAPNSGRVKKEQGKEDSNNRNSIMRIGRGNARTWGSSKRATRNDDRRNNAQVLARTTKVVSLPSFSLFWPIRTPRVC